MRTPWLVGPVRWTPAAEKRAVIWLSQKVKKPLLKLEARDFREHGCTNCSASAARPRPSGSASSTSCWEDLHAARRRDERQKILVFSPHPDDDVISMGGTLIALVEQGHDVHIAYMTSGNIAVFDHDALRHIDYVSEFHKIFGAEQRAGRGAVPETLRRRSPPSSRAISTPKTC